MIAPQFLEAVKTWTTTGIMATSPVSGVGAAAPIAGAGTQGLIAALQAVVATQQTGVLAPASAQGVATYQGQIGMEWLRRLLPGMAMGGGLAPSSATLMGQSPVYPLRGG